MNIKDMVKGKTVRFVYFKENELWYTTECGFEFPVPLDDTAGAVFNSLEDAIYFMRWINKHIKYIEEAKVEE